MGFYDEMSRHYDHIFPVKKPQLEFLTETLGKEGNRVLDIACATGGYAVALARKGCQVTAFDLDGDMVKTCRDRVEEEGLDAEVFQGDMLKVGELDGFFDVAYCIGNSLVHLDTLKDVETFLTGCRKVLAPQGRLVIQIVNYDRILNQGVKSLPTIVNEEGDLSFQRSYAYEKETGKILFTGRLEVGEEVHENTVALLPVRTETLIQLLEKSGFDQVEVFGDFGKKPFDPMTSVPAVFRARAGK